MSILGGRIFASLSAYQEWRVRLMMADEVILVAFEQLFSTVFQIYYSLTSLHYIPLLLIRSGEHYQRQPPNVRMDGPTNGLID